MAIMELVNFHIKQMKARIGIDYAIATLKKYQVTQNKLIRFLKIEMNKTDSRLKDLDSMFITDFDLYMKLIKKNDQNTTTKHCKNLKTIIN